MAEVVITEFMEEMAVELIRDHFSVIFEPDLYASRSELLNILGDTRALVIRNQTQVDSGLLERAPRLELVGRLGVGLDNIDTEECQRRNISVQTAAGANAVSVAEWAVGAILVLSRRCFGATSAVLAGEWPRTQMMGSEISGKLLGLVGLGQTARMLSDRAQTMGMRVLGTDPMLPSSDPVWSNITKLELEPLLAVSDVVSLHVPLTADTENLINSTTISLMKPGAMLLNSSRGGVVDEEALAEALRTKHLGGAALDVFVSEPMTAERAQIWEGIENLLLTPHIGGLTVESQRRVSDVIARAVIDTLSSDKVD